MEGRKYLSLLGVISIGTILLGVTPSLEAEPWGVDIHAWPSSYTSYEYISTRFGTGGSIVMATSPSSAGGTTDNTGLAMAANGSATQAYTGESSTCSGSSDLTTATLVDQHNDNAGAAGTYAEGRTLVDMFDVLTFTNPTAGPADVTTVPYTLTVSGSMGVDGPGFGVNTPENSLSSYFYVDSVAYDTADITVNMNSGTGYVPVVSPGAGNWTYTDAGLMVDTGTFTFTGTSASHSIWFYLDSSGSAATSDYTMTMSMDTPSTVTMNSASGEFLTAAPEPAAAGILVMALPALLRRSKRRV
ncbi:MAG TPA: hypothetical protein VGG19_07210 [Tepidisphaeraceae bacterium]|jgi:hypothetical protein